ncbi:sulfurtransferase [Lujinxingia sediminis]|uniref:Sulfurtransferase n=1 Tax=Lujinxingia sediminis TaxID=2480984 RepID=A0ABY0CNT3_9DELT|nr:sulfurtransferase [Lujinxingia sediminis]
MREARRLKVEGAVLATQYGRFRGVGGALATLLMGAWILCASGAICPVQAQESAPRGDLSGFGEQAVEVFVDVERARTLIAEGAAVLDAREASDFRRGHLPGAANVPWTTLVSGEQQGALAGDAHLEVRLREAGVSNGRPVVVYGGWRGPGTWGEEGRLHWTLEYLGHERVYVLWGGIQAWEGAGHELESGAQADRSAGHFEVRRREAYRATTAEVQAALSRDDVALLDTREAEEYGGKVKYGESRAGHIPGAQHLWWEELFEGRKLKSRRAIEAMLKARGIERTDEVIAYCTGGIRSGFVYSVLRALGYGQVANYDASMWEWTRQSDRPVRAP